MLLVSLLEKINSKRNWLFIILGVTLIIYFVSMLFFRYPMHDETLYLQETIAISEILKGGEWIGNYGVGVHGFLFKLPLALVFLMSGPSVLIATLYTYLLAIVAVIFTYLVAKEVFKNRYYALITTFLFAFSFEFIRSTPTYLREIPSVLTILLFTYLYIKNWNKWMLGIAMLLILDSKEYMFFIVGVAYVITELIKYFKTEEVTFNSVLNLIWNFIKVFLPSVIYIVLMFTTSLVPVNMFIASILSLIDRSKNWNAQQFSVDSGTMNAVNSGDVKEIGKITYRFGIYFLDQIIGIINLLLGYLGKFVYPRSFSFISIPKIILIPSIIFGFLQFKEYFKKNDVKQFIFILVAVFLLIFMLRNSHGRYLFSISPFIFMMLVTFFMNISRNIKLSIVVILIAWIFEAFGLFFETTWEIPKMLISLSVLISFLLLIYFGKNKVFRHLSILIVSMFIMGLLSLSSITYLYTQGQIYYSLKYGSEFEAEKILPYLKNSKFVVVNDTRTTQLLPFYLSESYTEPFWKWGLKPWLPKSNMGQRHQEQNILVSDSISNDIQISSDSILVMFDSTAGKTEFSNERLIQNFLSDSRYQLKNKVELKGKVMYIFQTNENNN